MTRVHEKKQILGSEMQQNCTKNLKTEDGMGFESGKSVVFLLVVLLAIEVALIFFKQVFVVNHKTSLCWVLWFLHEQQVCTGFLL